MIRAMDPPPIFIGEKKYMWDGQVFDDRNKAKTHARRYLRQGFEVHMENKDGNFLLFKWRPWPFEPPRQEIHENGEAAYGRRLDDETRRESN
jgi:hypothetical protein